MFLMMAAVNQYRLTLASVGEFIDRGIGLTRRVIVVNAVPLMLPRPLRYHRQVSN